MTGLVSIYPEFKLSYSAQVPEQLRDLIYSFWQYRYQELYEDYADAPISIEQSCENILDHLISYNSNSSYLYLMWMGLILGSSVQPTLTAYLPNDPRAKIILNLALSHFISTKNQIQYYNYFNLQEKIEFTPNINQLKQQLFPQLSEGTQALDEALDVFQNLLKLIDPYQAKTAILGILEDCLEGYAIFPGSQHRRDLFNWWLLDVVPATWCFKYPKKIYTIKGLKRFSSEQFFEI
ncbi:hypothetical protein [Planktothrix agardhii]|uniref:hypothetical protein n=1 Tax=Planktothrix agardhii TaxID=1160 RepID=UPI0020A753B7|nr:hypothetical protein [Planktothrix agardhii]CAD5953939.1 hypothetical protein NO758_02713 [Planktothrix agardhii]